MAAMGLKQLQASGFSSWGALCSCLVGGAGPLKSSVGLPAGREGAGDRNVGTSEEK